MNKRPFRSRPDSIKNNRHAKINRRQFLRSFVGLSAAGTTAAMLNGCTNNLLSKISPYAPRKKQMPNLIIIFTDDQGYADVGCFGAEGFKTPSLDRMAAEGMIFTDFYVGAPSCTPSRAALMTGCYPQRVSLPAVLQPRGRSSYIGLNEKETTIAEMLKSRGYATACVGKWHLGHRTAFLPVNHGFDEFFGFPYSHDMWPNHPVTKDYPDLPLMEGEKVIEYNPDPSRLTTLYTQRSVDFIKRNTNRPFFLYLAHPMPHVPLAVSDKFKGKSEQGLFGDVIMEIDWSVGRVLETLKQCNIDKDTLVIFTSDNGPWLAYGDHAGSAEPLREGKGTTFDGGQREPCIMSWPGKIPAASVCSEVATTMDILPTMANLTGADLPEKPIDGKDIRPLMTGRAGAKSPHECLYYYRNYNLEAVRCGKWKLHFPHKYRTLGSREGGTGQMPVKYEWDKIELALFNLEKDVGEKNNVAEQNPQIVARLEKLADKMREQLGDTLRGIRGKAVRPPGAVNRL